MRIIIGTCGFPRRKELLYSNLDGVEIQETFYNMISEKRAETLKRLKPEGFVYTMKAWQVITHPPSSPTWKRLKKKPPGNLNNYGHLRPTKENIEALKQTISIASTVQAEVIVLQTPPSMKCSGRLDEIESFFQKAHEINKPNILIAWEPRGECKEEYSNYLENLSRKHSIIIIKDAGREEPSVHKVLGVKILYTRLHGIGGKEVNYKYKYTREDLLTIHSRIISKKPERAYIMFNNIYMFEDAVSFKRLTAERSR